MRDEQHNSDLEDGEIREDALEDISDCSMSEIDALKKSNESGDVGFEIFLFRSS